MFEFSSSFSLEEYISFQNIVSQLVLFTRWGDIQDQLPGMRTCWASRQGVEQVFWEGRALRWQRLPSACSEMISRPVHMRSGGKGQWALEGAWLAGVGSAFRTQALIVLGLFFLQESLKQIVLHAWDPAICLLDSILHASLKKRPFGWQQIFKVLIQLLNFLSWF